MNLNVTAKRFRPSNNTFPACFAAASRPLRRYQFYCRKVGSIALRVTGKQGKGRDNRMRPDEKIRQHAGSDTPRRPVTLKRLASQKQRGARHWHYRYSSFFQDGVQGLDQIEAN